MGLSNYLPSSRIAQAGVIPDTANRPASPYEGQMLYQKDTNQVLVYDGSAWVMIADTDQPPGLQRLTSGTFTGITSASTLVISDVLTTDFPHCRIVIRATWSTAAGYINLQLRNSGGAVSGANYDAQLRESYSTTSIESAAIGNTQWLNLAYNYNQSHTTSLVVDLFHASDAVRTTGISHGMTKRSTGGSYLYCTDNHLYHDSDTSVTGFTVSASAGTMAGEYHIYGFRD